MPYFNDAAPGAQSSRSCKPSRARRVALHAAAALSLAAVQCNSPSTSVAPPDSAPVFNAAFSATSSQVRSFIAAGHGGAKAKLIYVDETGGNGGTLNYIDFSEAAETPAIHIIKAVKAPAVPVISPDGNYAVYASGDGPEAGSSLNQRSSVYLVKLAEDAVPVLLAKDSACEPRFVQNNPGKLSVIYSTLAPDRAWEGYGQVRRVDIDLSGAAPAPGAPTVFFASGSYTGGLSYDNRWICGGGGDVAMLDLQSGHTRPETLSYQGIQACNASITSSRIQTNNMMYLNTSGSNPSVKGGKAWGEWQTVLVSNSDKKLVKVYSLPDTFAVPLETNPKSFSNMKWHHPEWSNHPYFAAATLNVERYFKNAGGSFDNTEHQERLYLLNLKDSTYLEVIHPDSIKAPGKTFDASGYFWPWLWVEVPDGFQETAGWLDPMP